MPISGKTTSFLFQGIGERLRVQCQETPPPELTESRVKVLACTICGSDLHSIAGRRTVPTPSILGHEIVGEIVEFGPEAERIAINGEQLNVGDRICWSPVANCDHCFYCKHDLPQKCSQMTKYGHHLYESPSDLTGGFAEHCILTMGTKIMRLPSSMSLEVACPTSCATATIACAIETAKLERGEIVVVVGAGMLGITACAMAKERGATHVICVEPSLERRQRAFRFGAELAITGDELNEAVRDLTNGRGADCVLECSGSNQAFESAMKEVRLGGRMVLVGAVFPQSPVPIVLERIVRRNLSLIGVHNYAPRNLKQAVDFLDTAASKYPFASLVAAWYPLIQLEQAIEHASDGKAIRVGVKPL